MEVKQIIKFFEKNDITYDDILEVCAILIEQFKDNLKPEAVENLKVLVELILEKQKEGRSIYPIKQEILKFILIIIKKYN